MRVGVRVRVAVLAAVALVGMPPGVHAASVSGSTWVVARDGGLVVQSTSAADRVVLDGEIGEWGGLSPDHATFVSLVQRTSGAAAEIVRASGSGSVPLPGVVFNRTFLATATWSPSSRLVAFSGADHHVWVLDVVSLRVTNLGLGVADVVWRPDSRAFAFSSTSGSTPRLAVATVDGARVVSFGWVDPQVSVTWSSDSKVLVYSDRLSADSTSPGGLVWIAAGDGSHAHLLMIGGKAVVPGSSVLPQSVGGLSADGRRVLVENGSVLEIVSTAGKVEARLPSVRAADAWATIGHRLLVNDAASGAVYAYDDARVHKIAKRGWVGVAPAPRGAFTLSGPSAAGIVTASLKLKTVAFGRRLPFPTATWSPDGKAFVAVSSQRPWCSLVSAAGSQVGSLQPCSGTLGTWSADSTRFLFRTGGVLTRKGKELPAPANVSWGPADRGVLVASGSPTPMVERTLGGVTMRTVQSEAPGGNVDLSALSSGAAAPVAVGGQTVAWRTDAGQVWAASLSGPAKAHRLGAWSDATAAGPVVVSPDGERLMLPNGTTIVAVATGATLFSSPQNLSPDMAHTLTGKGSGTGMTLGTAGVANASVTFADTTGVPGQVVWSLDSSKALVAITDSDPVTTSQTRSFWLVDAATHDTRSLGSGYRSDTPMPAFSPNGATVALVSMDSSGVATLTLAATNAGSTVAAASAPYAPTSTISWAPDSAHVAVLVSNGPGANEMLISDATGAHFATIPRTDYNLTPETPWVWAQDGSAFLDINGDHSVVVATDGTVTAVTGDLSSTTPMWSANVLEAPSMYGGAFRVDASGNLVADTDVPAPWTLQSVKSASPTGALLFWNSARAMLYNPSTGVISPVAGVFDLADTGNGFIDWVT